MIRSELAPMAQNHSKDWTMLVSTRPKPSDMGGGVAIIARGVLMTGIRMWTAVKSESPYREKTVRPHTHINLTQDETWETREKNTNRDHKCVSVLFIIVFCCLLF